MPGKAKSKIELIVESKVKDALRDLDRTDDKIDKLNKSGKKSSAIFSKAGKVMGGFIGAVALKEVAQYTLNLAKLGDAAKQVEEPFKKLVRAAGRDFTGALNDLRKAVRGTATDLELMQRSSAAMDAFTASGMNAAEAFEATQQTMDFLYRYATKFGKNFNELMSTVFTGLQRGSALFLDDVGIMIDQTDAQFAGLDTIEKKSQIVRVALEQMAQKNELLGDVTEEANVKLKQAGVEYENLKVEIGKLLSEPVGEFFALLASSMKKVTTSLSLQSDKTEKERMRLNSLVTAITTTNKNQKLRNDLIIQLKKEYPDFLQNLKDDAISNKVLAERLEVTNKQLLNKILLQRADERRQSTAQDQADAYESQKEAIVDLSEKIIEYGKKFDLTVDKNKTLIEQAEELKQKINEWRIGSGMSVKQPLAAMNSLDIGIDDVKDTTEDYTEATEALKIKTSELIKLQEELGIVLEKVDKGVPDKTKWDKLRDAIKARYALEIKAAEGNKAEIIRLNKLQAAEIAEINKREKESKKTVPSKEDAKRLVSLQLKIKSNQIELDDTKDKYQKMRDIVIARYAAEIKAARGKTEITKALRQLESDEIAKINNQEIEELDKIKDKQNKELKQKEAEQTKAIQEIRNNIILEGMRDEFDIRLTEIQQYYDRELELAAGNADLIAALEEEKASRIKTVYDDLAQHVADTYFEQHEFQGALVDAASSGYDTFVRSMLDTQMSGAEKSQAIWNSMKQVFIGSLADMLKKYISNKMTELLIDTTLEKTKTSVRADGAAARAVISGTEIANSSAVTSANTAEAASGYMEAHSNIPFVGYAIGAAFVVAMLAMLSNIGKKSKGGIITNSELFKGYVPEGEDGLIGVQAGEEVMTRKATAKYRPVLDAMNADQPLALPKMRLAEDGFSISSLAAPQPVRQIIQREYYSEKVVERVPIEGKIVIETADPGFAKLKKHYIKVEDDILDERRKYKDRYISQSTDDIWD